MCACGPRSLVRRRNILSVRCCAGAGSAAPHSRVQRLDRGRYPYSRRQGAGDNKEPSQETNQTYGSLPQEIRQMENSADRVANAP